MKFIRCIRPNLQIGNPICKEGNCRNLWAKSNLIQNFAVNWESCEKMVLKEEVLDSFDWGIAPKKILLD